MSREIRPRAWHKPLGVMLQPEQIESINFETKVLGVYLEMDGKGFHRLRLSDFELMWPTSQQDQNDTDVYAGDKIIAILTGDIFEVIWDESGSGFLLSNMDEEKGKQGAIDWYEFEETSGSYGFAVIGNVYEHPHQAAIPESK